VDVAGDRIGVGREPDGRIGAGRGDVVGRAVVLHGHRGVLEDCELVRDLAGPGSGQTEHGDERAHAEDRAEHGQHGPARPLRDPGDCLGGRVPGGQPRWWQAGG